MDVQIKLPAEIRITCKTCGEPAIRREVIVAIPGLQTRMVGYDTHATSIALADHWQAMARLEAFHNKLFTLVRELKEASKTDAFKLSIGRITEIDLGNVIPTACNPRSQVVPSATVRAYKVERTVPYSLTALEGLSVESLLELLRPLCEQEVHAIKDAVDASHPGDD